MPHAWPSAALDFASLRQTRTPLAIWQGVERISAFCPWQGFLQADHTLRDLAGVSLLPAFSLLQRRRAVDRGDRKGAIRGRADRTHDDIAGAVDQHVLCRDILPLLVGQADLGPEPDV